MVKGMFELLNGGCLGILEQPGDFYFLRVTTEVLGPAPRFPPHRAGQELAPETESEVVPGPLTKVCFMMISCTDYILIMRLHMQNA